MAGLRQFLIDGLDPGKNGVDWLDPIIDKSRVFVGEIPQKWIDGHQKSVYNCIRINPTGFPGDGSEVPTSTIRVDLASYGNSFEEASDIDLAAYSLLKPLRGVVVKFNNGTDFEPRVYIYSAVPSGPIFSRDPQLDWACVMRTYRIRFGERDVKK